MFVYRIDKHRAIHHQYRIREHTLYFFSFISGGLAAFLAMFLFHHKTKKAKFYFVNLLSLFIHTWIILK